MKPLLQLEFRKLKRQKSFYIIFAIMAVMLLIAGASYKILANYAKEIGEISGETLPQTFQAFILSFVSASNFSMLTAIFVSIIVCDDYDNHIVKNIFSRGYSRTSFYFAKLVYVFITTSIMFFGMAVLALIFGGVLFGFEGLSERVILLIIGQYVVSMSGVALCFFIAMAVKKLGGTIALNIIVPMFVPLLLGLADTAFKLSEFKFTDVWSDSFLKSLSDINVGTGRLVACILGSLVYIAVFVFAGYAASKKTEV